MNALNHLETTTDDIRNDNCIKRNKEIDQADNLELKLKSKEMELVREKYLENDNQEVYKKRIKKIRINIFPTN